MLDYVNIFKPNYDNKIYQNFSEKFAKYKNSFIFATAIMIAYFNTG